MPVVPAQIVWLGEKPLLEWREVESSALARPFWEDTISNGRVAMITPLDARMEPPSPTALVGGIFHTYRCGSTLVCRQFSAVAGCFALSEPWVFSQPVMHEGQPTSLLRGRLLRLIDTFAQGLQPTAQRLIIKWPGLLSHLAPQLAAALPEVPALFLHRDPIEVLASIERTPMGAMEGLPDRYLGTSDELHSEAKRDQLGASAVTIAAAMRAVAKVAGMRRCDYDALPEATPNAIATYFGVALTSAGRSAIFAAGTGHSKLDTGSAPFTADGAAKRAVASPRVLDLAGRIVAPELAGLCRSVPVLAE